MESIQPRQANLSGFATTMNTPQRKAVVSLSPPNDTVTLSNRVQFGSGAYTKQVINAVTDFDDFIQLWRYLAKAVQDKSLKSAAEKAAEAAKVESMIDMVSTHKDIDEMQAFLKNVFAVSIKNGDGNLLGGSILHPPRQGQTYYLQYLAVDAALQGKGQGGKLLAEAIEHVRRNGGNQIILNADNPSAEAFFAGKGFQKNGIIMELPV